MSIKIIKQPDIHLTASELARYRYEYAQAFSMYCGPRPDFEEWVAAQIMSRRAEQQRRAAESQGKEAEAGR